MHPPYVNHARVVLVIGIGQRLLIPFDRCFICNNCRNKTYPEEDVEGELASTYGGQRAHLEAVYECGSDLVRDNIMYCNNPVTVVSEERKGKRKDTKSLKNLHTRVKVPDD